MKAKNYFKMGMVALAVLFLTACSNNEVSNDPKGSSDNVGTYMTLQLVGPGGSATSRTTAGEDQTEEGTAVQNKISKLIVLLCNQTDHKVKAQYNVSESDLIGIPGGVKTKQFMTETGTYDVYVIANPPASFMIADGETLTDRKIENISETLMKSDYAADNTFIMFNECNGKDKVAGSAITITTANDYDNPATCTPINLDRLAVQIKSNVPEGGASVTDITAENTFVTSVTLQGFKLLNGATQANLQQKWSKDQATTGTFPWDNILLTPSLAEGTNAGEAGYYNHLTNFRTIAINADTKAYETVKDLYATVNPYESTAKASIFCMENHPETAMMGNTTGLVYQFKTVVEGSDKKAGENCFYGYSNKYFATLAALQAAYPNAFDKAEGVDAVAKLVAAENELSSAYSDADRETKISEFRVKYNVKVYTEGIMYYTYFIKDKNYQDSSLEGTDKRYYSVMRNTIYNLTVTKLNRIGTDIPGGWTPDVDEPTDPVVPTNVYMVVEAKVNKWVLSNENINLE